MNKEEINKIISYYKWEKNRDIILREKKNELKETKFYIINKEYIEDWKLSIQYKNLKDELDKEKKEYEEKDINDVIKKLKLNINSEKNEKKKFKKINDIIIDEKENDLNKLLEKDKIEIINEDIFLNFKEAKNEIIEVECYLKEGKYFIKNFEEKKEETSNDNLRENKENKKNEKKELCSLDNKSEKEKNIDKNPQIIERDEIQNEDKTNKNKDINKKENKIDENKIKEEKSEEEMKNEVNKDDILLKEKNKEIKIQKNDENNMDKINDKDKNEKDEKEKNMEEIKKEEEKKDVIKAIEEEIELPEKEKIKRLEEKKDGILYMEEEGEEKQPEMVLIKEIEEKQKDDVKTLGGERKKEQTLMEEIKKEKQKLKDSVKVMEEDINEPNKNAQLDIKEENDESKDSNGISPNEKEEKNTHKEKNRNNEKKVELNEGNNIKLLNKKKKREEIKSINNTDEKPTSQQPKQILEGNKSQNNINNDNIDINKNNICQNTINENNNNEFNNSISLNNNNIQNNYNNQNININFNPMMFQMFFQQYLFEHGFENNFVNNFLNYCPPPVPKDEEEKQIINHYKTKANDGKPNIFNGYIILNTQLPSLGLQNVGATCYMNSTLQCLIHIKELSELLLGAFYLKFPRELVDFQKNHKLTFEYINILEQVFFPKLQGNTSICYAPERFKQVISELNPLFQGIAANDAKDLLQFILERLHQELKMAIMPYMEYNFDQRNEEQAKKYFNDSYISQNQSPLLHILYGTIKIITKCLKCKTIKYNFQSYNLLYFPLKESKKYIIDIKKNENNDFDESKYILTLEDCFLYNEKNENFTGDNQMYCNICNGLHDSTYQSMLFYTPPVLAIVLNRGRANMDFTEKFIFNTELNIEKFIHNEQKKGKYYLIGMVIHYGESSMSGHFIAYCRMDRDSKWFCYNDAYVSECKDFDDIVKRGTPYILFYHQE